MPRDEAVAGIRQHLAAAPPRVFAAFADPSLVSRWLTPSPDVALRVMEFDFRVGGAYRFAYDVPGGPTMFVDGLYRTIESSSTIVFSWNIEPPDEHAGVRSEVTVTLTPRGTGTDLRVRHAQLTLPGACQRRGGRGTGHASSPRRYARVTIAAGSDGLAGHGRGHVRYGIDLGHVAHVCHGAGGSGGSADASGEGGSFSSMTSACRRSVPR